MGSNFEISVALHFLFFLFVLSKREACCVQEETKGRKGLQRESQEE
jgi:hypothetical protein